MTRTGMLVVTSCLVFGAMSCSSNMQTLPDADSTNVVDRRTNTQTNNPVDAQQSNNTQATTNEQEAPTVAARVAGERRERDQLAGERPLVEQAAAVGFADASSVIGSLAPPLNRYDPNFNTESYAHIVENGFLGVEHNPLSTFSIDVDRASYANVRRFINDGQRPPIDAVRIEELVNYFHYDLPDPSGEHPFSITTEVTRAPWNTDHRLVRIGLQGQRVDLDDQPPSNLVFLLDVSGSMNSPDKLPLLKDALGLLVNSLREEDHVAIVVYAGAAGLVLESTSGDQKEVILDAIERLSAGGSTAGGV